VEEFFEELWRQSGLLDIAHGLETIITDTWYGPPLLVGSLLLIVGLLFRLTLGIHRRALDKLKQRDEDR